MMRLKVIGGPFDGGYADEGKDPDQGACIPIDGTDRYACYSRVPSDLHTFDPDGNYHYFKIVDVSDLVKE